MVIFKPDGSHGMYSLIHVALATACAAAAWYALLRPDRFPKRFAPERESPET